MTREDAISIAREALQRQGFSFTPEPDFVELIPAEQYNKYLTATQLSGPLWLVTFPLKNPNHIRCCASISVDDATGEPSEGQTV
jgi:hypothetical protein